MFFTKYPHPANFVFVKGYESKDGTTDLAQGKLELTARSFEGDVFHLAAKDPDRWSENLSLEPLDAPPCQCDCGITASSQGDFEFHTDDGKLVARTVRGAGFGVCAEASIFQFEVPEDALFFGMGEKWFNRLELSGIRTKFWNTDVWSDFHWGQWAEHPVDPPYFSFPYLAMRSSSGWTGFLLHNPGTTFMETPGRDTTRVFVEWQRTARHLLLGSECGEPHLWILHADSLGELTEKLQQLVGKTPLPPIWSLGYQQSRWGYGGHKDLLGLDAKFEKLGIPCTGLWLDLDYMDGFRIFEVSKRQFPEGPSVTAGALSRNSRRIVPIIDPGVKQEPGYRVYDDGHTQGVFCKNPEGKEFVGLVWPGETVFPDFTEARVRDWWAGYAKDFRSSGFGACWVDMNDPSTGPVDPTGMLFRSGSQAHALHRNQYALGMQMATFEGFRQACPNERPFILSRSGFIGTSKYAAVWTGDNISNEFYLQQSIPTTLGMSISGQPFNGPDIGGFGGDAGDELMARWFEACFLFPFFRNHSTLDSRLEEPWRYPAKTQKTLAHFIRLRHQFLPFLYQLFVRQEETGEALVRPLIYDFDDASLADVADQFMVGPWLMHAPILKLGDDSREVVLPGREPWFGLSDGKWRKPGRHVIKAKLGSTPLFVRAGAMIPLLPDLPTDNRVELTRPMFFVAVPDGWSGKNATEYVADDGLTYDYQKGKRSKLEVRLEGASIQWEQTQAGFGGIAPTFVTVGVDQVGDLSASSDELRLSGKQFAVKRWN
ncbi:MAG: hypothetical protein JSS66_09360 [Armatimonadetes bacterium]|nr:hypothetical protein [Armatimonadota bacterium]